MAKPTSSRVRTQRYRDGLRRRGLRAIQIWVPDPRAPGFAAEIQRQCDLINIADRAEDVMEWAEEISIFDENNAR